MARAVSRSTSAPGNTRRATLREEQKSFTRCRLIEGAVEVFEERGFEDATVDDIAVAAGASRATFYLHFKSKAEVVDALLERITPDIEAYYTALDEALASGSREEFRSWVVDALGWFREHETVVLALEHIMISNRAAAPGVVYSYTDYMPRLLEKWPEDRRLEAKLRVWMLVAMVGRVHMLWGAYGQMPEVQEDMIVEVLTDLWSVGLDMPKAGGGARKARPARRAPAS